MTIKRHATAHWEGNLESGQGRMSTPQSGLFEDTRYSFKTRFADEKGTNPEELLAVVSNLLSRVERTSAELARLVSTAKGEESSSLQDAPDSDFTEAEARVARLVAEGLTNKEIAALLNDSLHIRQAHRIRLQHGSGDAHRRQSASGASIGCAR